MTMFTAPEPSDEIEAFFKNAHNKKEWTEIPFRSLRNGEYFYHSTPDSNAQLVKMRKVRPYSAQKINVIEVATGDEYHFSNRGTVYVKAVR